MIGIRLADHGMGIFLTFNDFQKFHKFYFGEMKIKHFVNKYVALGIYIYIKASCLLKLEYIYKYKYIYIYIFAQSRQKMLNCHQFQGRN